MPLAEFVTQISSCCLFGLEILTGTRVMCSCVAGPQRQAGPRNAPSMPTNTNQTLGGQVGAADAQFVASELKNDEKTVLCGAFL